MDKIIWFASPTAEKGPQISSVNLTPILLLPIIVQVCQACLQIALTFRGSVYELPQQFPVCVRAIIGPVSTRFLVSFSEILTIGLGPVALRIQSSNEFPKGLAQAAHWRASTLQFELRWS